MKNLKLGLFNKDQILFIGILFMMGVVVTACGGGVKRTQAPRKTLITQDLVTFPIQKIELNLNNMLFFWKRDFTGDQVSSVLKLSKLLDQIDSAVFPWVLERNENEKQAIKLRLNKNPIDSRLREIGREIRKLETELKNTPAEDIVRIAELQKLIENIKKEKNLKEMEKAKLESELTILDQNSVELNQKMESFTLPGSTLTAKGASIQLESLVDQLQKIGVITFDQNLDVEIRDWNPSGADSARTLSTGDGQIKNVTYTPLGGVYTFDVLEFSDESQRELKETFHFRVVRVKYDIQDRVFFSGDVVRQFDPDYCTKNAILLHECQLRYGVIKLVGRSG